MDLNAPLIYLVNTHSSKNRLAAIFRKHENTLEQIKILIREVGSLNEYFLTAPEDMIIINNDSNLLKTIFPDAQGFPNYANERRMQHEIIYASNFPGEYYPRIFRPLITETTGYLPVPRTQTMKRIERLEEKELTEKEVYFPENIKFKTSSLNQFSVISNDMTNIFQTINPDIENFSVFGHKLRNAIILTCTEIEAQFRGILVENGVSKSRYTTADFVKLKSTLKLDEYSIILRQFPWIGEFNPFGEWSNEHPTQSLYWYSAYNALKHDRENEFNKAKLENLILAVCGLTVLLVSQYGEDFIRLNYSLTRIFKISKSPDWALEESYLPPLINTNWNKKHMFN